MSIRMKRRVGLAPYLAAGGHDPRPSQTSYCRLEGATTSFKSNSWSTSHNGKYRKDRVSNRRASIHISVVKQKDHFYTSHNTRVKPSSKGPTTRGARVEHGWPAAITSVSPDPGSHATPQNKLQSRLNGERFASYTLVWCGNTKRSQKN